MLSRLRAATATLATPAVLEFWGTALNPGWSARPLARVIDREQASVDAVTLVLRPNRNWSGVVPGQHVNVTVEVNGRRMTRAYSPSPVAGRHGCVAITVKAIHGGIVSTHLCDITQPGDFLELGPAYGEMRATGAVDPLLLLAAGSGITPLMAMARDLAAQGMPVPVRLLYWSRTRAERCFESELRALARKHPNFQVRFVLTGEVARSNDERYGRISADVLGVLDRIDERRVFACGPAGFVDAAQALVGTQAKSFLAEAFSPPAEVAGDVGTVRVTLSRSGKTLELSRQQSLLEALEEQGLSPAYGCRRGICNTCACVKTRGATKNIHTGQIDREPALALRICVSRPATDLVIEL